VNKKVLFLNGNSSMEFYNNERNKYKNITATSIFKSNSIFNRILRKFILIVRLPNFFVFFDDWKRNIGDYDLFIISSSIYSLEIAKYIRKRSNKTIIHWYWNPVIREIKPNKLKSDDSEIFSFDQDDCKQYGMNYISTYYFSSIQLPQNEITNDIYFMGADKGRISKLLDLKKAFKDQRLKVEFLITKSSNSKKVENYTFHPRIPYAEVLEGISKSRAILDYVQVGQTGMSQRPMEAIFHKRKLITNDVNICKYDFYEKNNIFILGKDDMAGLNKFINSPYVDIEKEIISKYDFGNWLDQIKRQINTI
jgi:hypothetical protein